MKPDDVVVKKDMICNLRVYNEYDLSIFHNDTTLSEETIRAELALELAKHMIKEDLIKISIDRTAKWDTIGVAAEIKFIQE